MVIDVLTILFFLGTSPNCEGKGICKLQIEKKGDTIKGNCVEAYIGKFETGIAIAITEERIKDDVFLKYFTGDFFEIPVDYVLPLEITEELGLKKGYTIKKGKYKFKQSATDIVLVFK